MWCYPVEVGFRGTSPMGALRQTELTGKERTKTVNEISEVADKTSSCLLLRRSESR